MFRRREPNGFGEMLGGVVYQGPLGHGQAARELLAFLRPGDVNDPLGV